jgi:hypothetical protein
MADGTDKKDWEDQIAQIEEIAKGARSVWISILTVGVFCFITVLSVKDSDLFTNKLSLKLPVIDVSIDAVTFFFVAPVVLLALYVQFQLSLSKYWALVAELPHTLDDAASGRKAVPTWRFIHPWLFGDAAVLWVRGAARSRGWPEVFAGIGALVLGTLMTPAILAVFPFFGTTCHATTSSAHCS